MIINSLLEQTPILCVSPINNKKCDNCLKLFKQKGHLEAHKNRKQPCKTSTLIEQYIEKNVQEPLTTVIKIEPYQPLISMTNKLMDSHHTTTQHPIESHSSNQMTDDKHNSFVYQTMLTCIGNKRKLVSNIRNILNDIRTLLSKERLNIVDGFAGSSVVSRELSYIANNLYTNDMELYSYLMAYCYLVNPSICQKERILNHLRIMNEIAEKGPYHEGIICKLYAPKDTKNIKEGERCFYTRENALIIDTLRRYITENVEEDIVNYCLVPLLNKASINTNTAGVFKGFYKKDNIGCFGGKGECALSRITKPIRLDTPVWNDSVYTAFPSNKDINVLVDELPDNIDVMYLDPPYNQHPYGSNYFMLNVIATYKEPSEISNVSGIPTNWNKSNYNKHKSAIDSMKQLLSSGLSKSKYLVISYNNEGIITDSDWKTLFEPYNVKKYEITYDTYKGSRNLKGRSDKVIEIMYLVSKKE
jgi:adenine-specific DNA-methyltransferase